MQVTSAIINGVAARTVPNADALAAAMNLHFPDYQITTRLRVAHWLAQASHETGGFKWLVELGGPSYFQKYDGRADLGNTQPGDGYRFRGRGIFQLTGRANYAKFGDLLDMDLITKPDLAAEPGNAVLIACAFWGRHILNPDADRDDVVSITKAINGGVNGLDDRKAALSRAKYLIPEP